MNKQKLTIKNSSDECATIADFLKDYIQDNNISVDVLDDLRLVLEETFINIVNYAHPAQQGQAEDVNIELSHDPASISMTFIDNGEKFDPLADNTKQMDIDDLCDGGMGIHIIKSLSDEQHYQRVGQHNVFTVTKHYTKQH